MRQIVVLDATLSTDGTLKTLSVVFVCWLAAPSTRVVVLPNFTSRVPLSTAVPWGITSAELAALVAGTFVDQTASCPFDLTLVTPTLAQMEASLQAKYSALQTNLSNQAFSLAHVVGASYDGTTWTAGP